MDGENYFLNSVWNGAWWRAVEVGSKTSGGIFLCYLSILALAWSIPRAIVTDGHLNTLEAFLGGLVVFLAIGLAVSYSTTSDHVDRLCIHGLKRELCPRPDHRENDPPRRARSLRFTSMACWVVPVSVFAFSYLHLAWTGAEGITKWNENVLMIVLFLAPMVALLAEVARWPAGGPYLFGDRFGPLLCLILLGFVVLGGRLALEGLGGFSAFGFAVAFLFFAYPSLREGLIESVPNHSKLFSIAALILGAFAAIMAAGAVSP